MRSGSDYSLVAKSLNNGNLRVIDHGNSNTQTQIRTPHKMKLEDNKSSKLLALVARYLLRL